MKKILWFSNCQLSSDNMVATGTWLFTMMEALLNTGKFKLYNITQGSVSNFSKQDWGEVQQWIIPRQKINHQGLPGRATINFLKRIEEEINPDLIHIWGTESFWGMLNAARVFKTPVLLDMQGVLSACARVFYGGLTNIELLQTTSIKEVLLPMRHLYFRKKEFEQRARHEKFIIQNTSFISVQSEWVEAHINAENCKSKIFFAGIILRKEFYIAKQWEYDETRKPIIFSSSSGSISYKGLHILFRAVSVVKQKFPAIKLRIGGKILQKGKIQDGYTQWLLRLAKKLKISDAIEWLGPLNASQIVHQLQACSVAVNPSVVETYSLALAESMMVGVPSIVSYAGAMPELASHNQTALYFPAGDFISCAWQIEKVLKDRVLCERLSAAARNKGLERNNPEKVVSNQLQIYSEVFGE